LKRDFQKISERNGEAGRIGRLLLRIYEKIFGFWKTEYNSLIDSKKRKKRLRYFKNKMLKGLVAATQCGHERTARTCENILRLQNSLWHFFENENISPTNNHAERQLRPLVISKKLSFGTQSDRGSRFIERIFTVITSCKQQGIDSLAFIIAAIQNFFIRKIYTSTLCS
jgi:transposase